MVSKTNGVDCFAALNDEMNRDEVRKNYFK